MTDLTQRTDIPSPCYVLEEAKLIKNLELMKRVQDESGARIILALKGYSMSVSYTHLTLPTTTYV